MEATGIPQHIILANQQADFVASIKELQSSTTQPRHIIRRHFYIAYRWSCYLTSVSMRRRIASHVREFQTTNINSQRFLQYIPQQQFTDFPSLQLNIFFPVVFVTRILVNRYAGVNLTRGCKVIEYICRLATEDGDTNLLTLTVVICSNLWYFQPILEI